MELKGQYTFDAPQQLVWSRLMDPKVIASCLPGCEAFEAIGENKYKAVMTAGVAAVSGSFSGTVELADQKPESSYRLIVEGSGRPGFARGEASISLTTSGAQTIVEVAGDMTVGGLVAQVGQRLLGATARTMMDRFFKCLQSKMT